MATFREQPYGKFNFLVDLGKGDSEVTAGFSEVQLPDASVDIYEYRNGNEKRNSARLLAGPVHYSNIVLKRGVIGALDLYEWFRQVQNGDPDARRLVTIKLLSENREEVVLVWKLAGTLPVKYTFSSLDAKSHEVLIEQLELAFEQMDIE